MERNYGCLTAYILFIVAAVFFVFKGCQADEEERMLKLEQEEKELAQYLSTYTPDITTFAQNYSLANLSEQPRKKFRKGKVVILRVNHEGLTELDVHFTKLLPANLHTSKLEEANTIVLKETEFVDVGEYSNSKTVGQRIDVHLYFVNPETKAIYYVETLTGSDPPSSIEYRRSAPETRSGTPPSDERILAAIAERLGE